MESDADECVSSPTRAPTTEETGNQTTPGDRFTKRDIRLFACLLGGCGAVALLQVILAIGIFVGVRVENEPSPHLGQTHQPALSNIGDNRGETEFGIVSFDN